MNDFFRISLRISTSFRVFSMLVVGCWASVGFAQGPSRSGFPSVPAELARQFPCGGEVLLDESFSGTGIPQGWTVLDADGQAPRPEIVAPPVSASPGWQSRSDFNNPFNRVLMSPSWYVDSAVASNDWLISPPVNLQDHPCLSWYAYSQDRFYGESYEVRISTASPDTTDFLANPALFSVESEANEFTYRSVSLAEYANQQVYIAFRHTSKDKFVLVLDDVRVAEVEQTDLSLFQVPTPEGGVGQELLIQGAIINRGLDPVNVDSVLNLTYTIDNGEAKTIQVRDTAALAPNDTLQFIHDSIWTPEVDDVYLLSLWLDGVPDDNPLNDTVRLWVGIGQFVGLDDPAQRLRLKVFPNPASEQLQVELPTESARPGALRLLDVQGRVVRPEQPVPAGTRTARLSLQGLSTGVYVLQWLRQGAVVVSHKVWKQ